MEPIPKNVLYAMIPFILFVLDFSIKVRRQCGEKNATFPLLHLITSGRFPLFIIEKA
jgi:hypothetical protein